VRGFGDRATILLSGGNSVFNQPNGSGRQYPWNLSDTGTWWWGAGGETLAQCDGSLDHGWSTQHEAWDGGKMDDWISAKGSNRTMGYLTRSDIRVQRRLVRFHDHREWRLVLVAAFHRSHRNGFRQRYRLSSGGPRAPGGGESTPRRAAAAARTITRRHLRRRGGKAARWTSRRRRPRP